MSIRRRIRDLLTARTKVTKGAMIPITISPLFLHFILNHISFQLEEQFLCLSRLDFSYEVSCLNVTALGTTLPGGVSNGAPLIYCVYLVTVATTMHTFGNTSTWNPR